MSAHDLSRWKNRVALVTGASSGIGRAITRHLASAGMRLVAVARRADRLEALRTDLQPAEVLPVVTDLRDEQQILHAFERAREQWGGVDVLVNNAGLGYRAPLLEGPAESWREMLEVNVLALCVCTREAVSDMRRRGDDGHIIHISSMSGHRVTPGGGLYAATKFAVRALTEGLRMELRGLDSQIRVTAISPGIVETEFAARFHGSQASAEQLYSSFAVLNAEDVADAVDFALACPQRAQVHDLLLRPTAQTS